MPDSTAFYGAAKTGMQIKKQIVNRLKVYNKSVVQHNYDRTALLP